MNKEVIEISRGNKMRQVVEITTVKGKKNRKGQPLKLSVTKHLSLNPKPKRKRLKKNSLLKSIGRTANQIKRIARKKALKVLR